MKTCEWFLLCKNKTDKGLKHPILGTVPCCDRCAGKFDQQSELVPLEVTA